MVTYSYRPFLWARVRVQGSRRGPFISKPSTICRHWSRVSRSFFFFFFFKLSQGGVTRGQAHTGRPPWFPQCPLPSRPPFPASLSPRTHVRHPGPRPPPLWPPFPFPLLSDGYGQGLSSDRELRLHQGGLPALRGCGLPADSTTPPPEACRPPASARRTERARAPAGAGKPGSPGAWEVAGELGSWEESV